MDKDRRLAWAFSILQERMKEGIHGSVSFSFQAGHIKNAEVVISERPPIDIDLEKA